ncbi:Transitional endoplasmic reticulum ATPase [Giardia muris]|uniref:Transitional endoplasmic reticulum ATPase n=1 Tax=Giardia muris TaxID=5742 RepID=A0A4Z1SWF3_GIAMU|nr:Transitional endoplasmic reticulum ATPase [Giardia muris]|eukprot:TNJ29195.1 Transitional endoplasmic reticulum ATPase [Giardia muris]
MYVKLALPRDYEPTDEALRSLRAWVEEYVREKAKEIAKALEVCGEDSVSFETEFGRMTVTPDGSGSGPEAVTTRFYFPATDEPEEVMHSNTILYTIQSLPHASFLTLWDSLVFPPGKKKSLRNLVRASRRLAKAGVDPNLILTHKMLLLHSVPGCGKTSVAMALAQELSVDMSPDVEQGGEDVVRNTAVLITVNAHALFSKWFSESGKIVTKMFSSISEEASDGKDVYLLIDEVESLAGSRERAMGAGEPSDMVRATNAMLTQLDLIKRHPNTYIICTTNTFGALDEAFIDRCDAVIGLDPPGEEARRLILMSSITELLCKRVLCRAGCDTPVHEPCTCDACNVNAIVRASAGKSGRQLRKLPYVALSRCMSAAPTLPSFLEAMLSTIDESSS